MKDTQHSDLVLSVEDLVDCDVREWGKGDLSGSRDTPETAKLRKCLQSADALYDRLCYASGRIGAVLGDVVADPFEIIRSVRRPADAHQPR
jgi:hypothetical protein